MTQKEKKPVPIVMRFFHWFCRPDFREEIEGDLMEQFHIHYIKYGSNKANLLFIKEVMSLFRPSIIGNFNHLTHTNTMEIMNQNKRLATILAIAISILLIPLVAMNLTNEVNWSLFDFIVVGGLLLGTGLILEFILRKIKSLRYRILLGIVLFLVLFLIWAELAVGIFGTPFAGS
ncbi:permease prefix domain 2-containing transporter [Altibacter sp.]|uniref:permease prefix domain 2-containing transporter n=1 Tax=Altibacter sp. TaxID=2024823 RepID=UPI0025BCD1A7|nr:permease prefix domain 2-containing transporter [Altibacter sp.]